MAGSNQKCRTAQVELIQPMIKFDLVAIGLVGESICDVLQFHAWQNADLPATQNPYNWTDKCWTAL